MLYEVAEPSTLPLNKIDELVQHGPVPGPGHPLGSFELAHFRKKENQEFKQFI